MATMIPPDVEQFSTDGEQQFYSFLQTVAKPDSAFIVWYCPDVEGREPDFILYNDQVGLLIFEVKDWALHQVIEADPRRFRLSINGKEESRPNPLEQAHQYQTQVFQAFSTTSVYCPAIRHTTANHGCRYQPLPFSPISTSTSSVKSI